MPFVRVASLSKLPPGSVMQVEVGQDRYAVCNANGQIHAVDGICPHSCGPLGQGTLYDDILICPWHYYEFDCRTGASSMGDDLRVDTFPVKVAGDDILIDVP